MKYFLALLLISLIAIGCGDESDKPDDLKTTAPISKYDFDTTDLALETVENPDQNFYFRYKFEKGKTYNYRLSLQSEVSQEIITDSTVNQKIEQGIVYIVSLSVNDVDQDSTMEITFSVNNIKLNMDGMGQQIDYEYGTVSDSVGKAQYAEYEAVAENPFSARINKYGEVAEIFRADKIANKYLQLRGIPDTLTSQEKSMLRSDIERGLLRPIVIQIIRKMPENKMAKDSIWTLKQPPQRLMSYNLVHTNMYKIIELSELNNDNVAVIEAGLNTSVTGESNITEQGVSYSFVKPTASGTGKIYFNLTDGFITRSKTEVRLSYSVKVEGSNAQGKFKEERKQIEVNSNFLELL